MLQRFDGILFAGEQRREGRNDQLFGNDGRDIFDRSFFNGDFLNWSFLNGYFLHGNVNHRRFFNRNLDNRNFFHHGFHHRLYAQSPESDLIFGSLQLGVIGNSSLVILQCFGCISGGMINQGQVVIGEGVFGLNGQGLQKVLLGFFGFAHHIGQNGGILVMCISVTRIAFGGFFETIGSVFHFFGKVGLQDSAQAIKNIREVAIDFHQSFIVLACRIKITLVLGQFAQEEKGGFMVGINFRGQCQLFECTVEVAGVLSQNQAIKIVQLCATRISFDGLFHKSDATFHLARSDQSTGLSN